MKYPNFHVLFVMQFFRTCSLRNMIFKGKIDPRMKDSVKFLVQEGRVMVKEI